MRKYYVSILVCGLLVLSSAALADGSHEESVQAEVNSLRSEVAELRQLVKSLAAQKDAAQKDVVQKKSGGAQQGVSAAGSSSNAEMKAAITKLQSQVKDASEWRNGNAKVHLAGYGGVGYTDQEKSDGSFNIGSFSPIFHFMYKDIAMLESELEFEVEDDGATATHLEYLAIDLFLNDYMTLVGGKFLTPIGQFRQNLHPSWINKLPSKPLGFGGSQAAPIDEVGLQLRGGFPAGEMRFNYAVYVGNGPSFDAGPGGSDFVLETSTSDENGNKVFGGRLGVLPIAGLEVGVSGATGDTSTPSGMDRDYDVYGADFNYQRSGAELRGEYVKTAIGPEAGASGDFDLEAWYLQFAYQLPFYEKLEPVVRWGGYDSPSIERRQWSIGLDYLFSTNVIGKIAYDISNNDGIEDADRFMAQLAYGF